MCCAFTSMCCGSSWGWLWQLCYVAPWESISSTVAHCRDISVFPMKQMFWFDFFLNILYLILLCAEGFLISKQSKISKSLNVFHSCHLFLWFTTFTLSPSDHNKRKNLAFELNCSPLSMFVIGSYETWGLLFGVYIYPVHNSGTCMWYAHFCTLLIDFICLDYRSVAVHTAVSHLTSFWGAPACVG